MDELLIPVFVVFLLLAPALVLALLLYLIPVRAAATLVRTAERQEQVVRISWGPIALRSSGAGTGRVTEVLISGHPVLSHTGPMETGGAEAGESAVPEPVSGKKEPIEMGELVHLVQAMIGPVGKFGSVFWQQSRFENARGTVTLGLGNPSLTGEVYGYYWASRFIFLASRIDIEMKPVFDRLVLELDITVRVKVEHPLLVMIAGLDLARASSTKDVIAYARQKRAGVAGV